MAVIPIAALSCVSCEGNTMRVAVPITLTKEERRQLLKFSKGRSTPARMMLPAKIVLQAAAGKQTKEIPADLGRECAANGVTRDRLAG